MLQTVLPERFSRFSDNELDTRIRNARQALGRRVVILGHHYQRDEVIKFADVRGDSLSWRSGPRAEKTPNTSFFAACTSWRKAPTFSAPIIKRSFFRI